MTEASLKPGWTKVKFGEVVRLCKDRSSDPEAEGIERYVGLEHLEPEDLRIRSWGLVADGTTFTSRFKPGQVLFGKRRAYQRKVAVADFEGVCSGDIYVFESANPKHLLPELLLFVCQSNRFFEYAVDTSAGSLSPRTNWKSLKNFDFLLPPLKEQERILETLKAIETTKHEFKAAKNNAENLRRSLLISIFDKLGNSGFVKVPVIGKKIDCKGIKVEDAGHALMGRQLSPKYRSGLNPRPYLRVANVFDGYIDTADVNEMDFTNEEFEVYQLQPGDILLNEGQSRELVGRSAIYRNEIDDCCFQNTLIRFRPIEGVLSEYAHYFFQYCQYTGRFIQVSKQTTSIAHLGVKRFAKMRFPLIEKDIQKEIVEVISASTKALADLQTRLASTQRLQKTISEKGLSQHV